VDSADSSHSTSAVRVEDAEGQQFGAVDLELPGEVEPEARLVCCCRGQQLLGFRDFVSRELESERLQELEVAGLACIDVSSCKRCARDTDSRSIQLVFRPLLHAYTSTYVSSSGASTWSAVK
jgi:hypothetical protein